MVLEGALNYLLSNIYESFNNNEYFGAIFLDLSKAFDTISHDILLYKLNYYGLCGKCYQLLTSYLANRRQFVSVNGVTSEVKPCNLGVPQGSILGPLLFIIYINDLPLSLEQTGCLLYADDTTLFCGSDDIYSLCNQLTADLNLLSSWLNANRLVLNINKSNFVVFSLKKYLIMSILLYLIKLLLFLNFIIFLELQLTKNSQLRKIFPFNAFYTYFSFSVMRQETFSCADDV